MGLIPSMVMEEMGAQFIHTGRALMVLPNCSAVGTVNTNYHSTSAPLMEVLGVMAILKMPMEITATEEMGVLSLRGV
jgi:hypothetical protein